MKCEKCGNENEEGQKKCNNCQYPLYPRFQIMWKSILVGVIVGFLVLGLAYMVYGKEGWFFFGLNFAALISGLVATIFSKRKNMIAVEDYNYILNSFLAGLIFYLVSLPVYIYQFSFAIFILAIGYGLFGFIGGTIGLFINILREQKTVLKITGILIIILVLSTVTYGLFFSNSYNEGRYYHDLGGYCIYSMYFSEAIDNQTIINLNGTPVYNIKNQTLRKDTALRYQRLYNITAFGLRHSKELYPYASYSIQKEYAHSLEKYFTLRLEYYTELEKAANLTINGNRSQAIKHYNKAQKLIPKIQKQKTVINALGNKDPEFKKRIDNFKSDANRMLERREKLNNWMNPEVY